MNKYDEFEGKFTNIKMVSDQLYYQCHQKPFMVLENEPFIHLKAFGNDKNQKVFLSKDILNSIGSNLEYIKTSKGTSMYVPKEESKKYYIFLSCSSDFRGHVNLEDCSTNCIVRFDYEDTKHCYGMLHLILEIPKKENAWVMISNFGRNKNDYIVYRYNHETNLLKKDVLNGKKERDYFSVLNNLNTEKQRKEKEKENFTKKVSETFINPRVNFFLKYFIRKINPLEIFIEYGYELKKLQLKTKLDKNPDSIDFVIYTDNNDRDAFGFYINKLSSFKRNYEFLDNEKLEEGDIIGIYPTYYNREGYAGYELIFEKNRIIKKENIKTMLKFIDMEEYIINLP